MCIRDRKYAAVCRKADFRVTCTLVYAGTHWELTRIEAGDTTAQNYGLAVDLGSTTVIMQSIDLNTGQVLAEKSRFNRQIDYGDEILSRIFYTKGRPDHLDELQASTVRTFCDLRDCLLDTSWVDTVIGTDKQGDKHPGNGSDQGDKAFDIQAHTVTVELQRGNML